jgi:mono/diheme cytochrome c family protein
MIFNSMISRNITLALCGALLLTACGQNAGGREAEAPLSVDSPVATEAVADNLEAKVDGGEAVAADANAQQAAAPPPVVVKLPGEPEAKLPPGPSAADKAAIASGAQSFAGNCASCHGEGGAGGFGPALTNLAARKDKRALDDIIRKPPPPMPPLYPAMLSDQDVTEIVAYLNSVQ